MSEVAPKGAAESPPQEDNDRALLSLFVGPLKRDLQLSEASSSQASSHHLNPTYEHSLELDWAGLRSGAPQVGRQFVKPSYDSEDACGANHLRCHVACYPFDRRDIARSTGPHDAVPLRADLQRKREFARG